MTFNDDGTIASMALDGDAVGLTPEQKYESHRQEMGLSPLVTKHARNTQADLEACIEALKVLHLYIVDDIGNLEEAYGALDKLPEHIKAQLRS